MPARDSFKDWNLYHKGVAAAVVAALFSVALRAFLVIDGGFELKVEGVVRASPETLWPMITENSIRDDWTAELLRVQGISVDVGRNRLLYWKRRYDQWRSYEITTALVQNRLFKTEQESDHDNRWWEIELIPQGECETRVRMREIIMPKEYHDRFWFFRVEAERQARLDYSLETLARKAAEQEKSCAIPPRP